MFYTHFYNKQSKSLNSIINNYKTVSRYIKLEKDTEATKTGYFGFTIDKGITLDLNNHTLHYTGDMYGIYVSPTSDITIKNGTITSAAQSIIYFIDLTIAGCIGLYKCATF